MREIEFAGTCNIGDTLDHLNFVRRLVQKHPVHVTVCAKETVLPVLHEVVEDLPHQITLKRYEDRSAAAINYWIGAHPFIQSYPGRNANHVQFFVHWFQHLSKTLDLSSPINTVEDLLFNYPAILKPNALSVYKWDCLVINTEPMSGQFRGYSKEGFDDLIRFLRQKYSVITAMPCAENVVPCTFTEGLSVTGVGNVSMRCRFIVGTANGPVWPTFNIWNHQRMPLRVLFVDNERLDYDQSCRTVSTFQQAKDLINGL